MRREKRKSSLLRFLLPLTVRQVCLTIITNNLNSPLKRESLTFFSLQIREKSLGKMERASSSLVTVRTFFFSSLQSSTKHAVNTQPNHQIVSSFWVFMQGNDSFSIPIARERKFWNGQARGESLFLYLSLPWLLGSRFNMYPSKTSWQESLMRKKRMDRGRKGVGRERRVEIVNEQIPIARIQYQ